MSTTLQSVDRLTWQQLLPQFRDRNCRQLWSFGVAAAARLRAESEHIVVYDRDRPVGLADVRVKRVPVIGAGIAYINGGPIVQRGEPRCAAELMTCLQALAREYVDRRRLILRIRMPIGAPEWLACQADVFRECGFELSAAVAPYRTMVVDLQRSLPVLRKSFEPQWRRCLNRAEERALHIRVGTSTDMMQEFSNLYAELVERKGFASDLDAAFYTGVQAELREQERLQVILVDFENMPVAGHVSHLGGDTCEWLLGAANEKGREQRAAYLMHWHAIQTAQKHGCCWYELGGIDPERYPGGYYFKKGLGGMEMQTPGPFEKAPSALRRLLAHSGESWYRVLRRSASLTKAPARKIRGST